MIDTISIKQRVILPKQFYQKVKEPIDVFNQTFNPLYSRLGVHSGYTSNLKNLKLTIKEEQGVPVLRVDNSLHKYYYNNNYTDFAFSDVQDSISRLENDIGVNLQDARVTKLAFGVNVETNPEAIYSTWIRYKKNDFDRMKSVQKVYGARADASQIRVKGYNKTLEVWRHNRKKVGKELFRLEVEVKKMAHLNKRSPLTRIPIYYLSDLLDQKNMELLAFDLMEKYETIERKADNPDYSKLTIGEKKIVGIMVNDTLKESIQRNSVQSRTYRRMRRDYQAIKKKVVSGTSEVVAKDKIYAKLEHLVNS